MTQLPDISVVILTHNRSAFLVKALCSVLDQSLLSKEIIICDDYSSDDTSVVVEPFLSKHPEIHYLRNEKNLGQVLNMKRGAEAARGAYLVFLHDDDFWIDNDFLSKSLAIFKKHPTLSTLRALHLEVWGKRLLTIPDQHLKQYNIVCGRFVVSDAQAFAETSTFRAGVSTTIFNKSLLLCSKLFLDPKNSSIDIELFHKLSLLGDVCFLYEYVGAYRFHDGQMSQMTSTHNPNLIQYMSKAVLRCYFFRLNVFSENELSGYRHTLMKEYLKILIINCQFYSINRKSDMDYIYRVLGRALGDIYREVQSEISFVKKMKAGINRQLKIDGLYVRAKFNLRQIKNIFKVKYLIYTKPSYQEYFCGLLHAIQVKG